MTNSVSGVGSQEPLYATVKKNNAEAGNINNKGVTTTKTPPDIEKIKNMLHMLSGSRKDLIESECAYATLDINVLDSKSDNSKTEPLKQLPKVKQSQSIKNFLIDKFSTSYPSQLLAPKGDELVSSC